MEESSRSEEGKAAGVWAIGELRTYLGDDWMERVAQHEGSAPSELILSPIHAVAFGELLDLALGRQAHTIISPTRRPRQGPWGLNRRSCDDQLSLVRAQQPQCLPKTVHAPVGRLLAHVSVGSPIVGPWRMSNE